MAIAHGPCSKGLFYIQRPITAVIHVLEKLSDLPSIAGRPEATTKVSDPAAPMNEDGKLKKHP